MLIESEVLIKKIKKRIKSFEYQIKEIKRLFKDNENLMNDLIGCFQTAINQYKWILEQIKQLEDNNVNTSTSDS